MSVLRCCWLDDENETCGRRAARFGYMPLCDEHRELHRHWPARRLWSIAGAAMRYHKMWDYPGLCYFAGLPDGTVKIGFSHTEELVRNRMESLTRQYGAPVIPLHVVPGGFVAEAVMHHAFDHLRLPGKGERFEFRDELAEYLEYLADQPLMQDRNG